MIARQEKGDLLIEYEKFPIMGGSGMSAALMNLSLKDMGKRKIKKKMVQTLEVEGGTIRKQVARIETTDQAAMDYLYQDLLDNTEDAKQLPKPNPAMFKKDLPPITRKFNGESLRLDRIGVEQ